MSTNKLPFAEDAFIHRSPMFSRVNYHFWKICIESIDQGIWNAIMNEPFIPKYIVNDKEVDKA